MESLAAFQANHVGLFRRFAKFVNRRNWSSRVTVVTTEDDVKDDREHLISVLIATLYRWIKRHHNQEDVAVAALGAVVIHSNTNLPD